MKAQLKNKIEPVLFLKAVKACRMDVLATTENGDRLDLKSTLSQYLFALVAGQEHALGICTIEFDEIDLGELEEYLQAE